LLLAEDYNNYNNNNNNVYLNVNNFTVFMSYFLNLCHVGYKNNKRLHQIISRHLEPYTNTLYTIYTYTFVYINYIRVTLQFTHIVRTVINISPVSYIQHACCLENILWPYSRSRAFLL